MGAAWQGVARQGRARQGEAGFFMKHKIKHWISRHPNFVAYGFLVVFTGLMILLIAWMESQ